MSEIVIDFPKSEAFSVFQYPAGETQVRLNKDYLEPIRLADTIRIEARVSNATDLLSLVMLSDAIYGWSLKEQVLRIPYLPYARADRRFVYGDCHGLQSLGKVLSLGHFSKVITLDVHSNKAFDYIQNLENEEPRELIKKSVDLIERTYGNGVVLLPDEGSIARYHNVSSWRTLNCSKKRDAETGKLLSFELPHLPQIGDGPILIVDDICDGGGTFLGIAAELKKAGKTNPLFLYVTHGIFSKGFFDLSRAFKGIFTTNSFKNKEDHYLKVFTVIRDSSL